MHDPAADVVSLQQQLQTLTYGVSHDLRGPLRGIQTHVAMLDKHLGDAVDPQARVHLDGIRDAAGRMGGLLDALSELSRAGRAPLRLEPLDLSLLADWAAAEVNDCSQSPQVEVEVQPGLQGFGDERLLKLALDHLVANACRFTRAAGSSTPVQVEGAHADGGLHLQVRDHGIGFDPQQASRAFEPFVRLHGADRGAGNGLGLAIVHEVVRRHGGRIWAEGAPDAGATFHLWLPDAPAG